MISDELRSGTESPQPFGTQGSDSVLEQWEDARDGPPFEFGHHEKLVDAADKLAEAYLALLKQTKAERAEHVVRDLIRMEKRAAKAEAENERLRAALRWYAAEGAWARTPTGGGHYNPAPASLDGGERARGALAEIKKEAGCDPRW